MTDEGGVRWHGWGLGGTSLSVAPHPLNSRAFALILTSEGNHRVLAEFTDSLAAEEAMNFLDAAFRMQTDTIATLMEQTDAEG